MFRQRRGEAFSLYNLFRLTNSWTLKCICILLRSLSVCLVGVICGGWKMERREYEDFGGARVFAHHFGAFYCLLARCPQVRFVLNPLPTQFN